VEEVISLLLEAGQPHGCAARIAACQRRQPPQSKDESQREWRLGQWTPQQERAVSKCEEGDKRPLSRPLLWRAPRVFGWAGWSTTKGDVALTTPPWRSTKLVADLPTLPLRLALEAGNDVPRFTKVLESLEEGLGPIRPNLEGFEDQRGRRCDAGSGGNKVARVSRRSRPGCRVAVQRSSGSAKAWPPPRCPALLVSVPKVSRRQ
jgi:hypothetical protein